MKRARLVHALQNAVTLATEKARRIRAAVPTGSPERDAAHEWDAARWDEDARVLDAHVKELKS